MPIKKSSCDLIVLRMCSNLGKVASMTTPPFALRLRAERQKRDLTIAELAERVECAKSTQQSYETGARVPDVDYLARLGRLGFDPMFLMYGQASMTRMPDRADFKRIVQSIKDYERKHGVDIPADLVVDFCYGLLQDGQDEASTGESNVERVLRLVVSR